MPADPLGSDDPLGLDAADRAIRINELEEQAKSLGMHASDISDECTPAEHQAFLENVFAYESAPVGTQFDRLLKAGVTLPPPESMDDATLHAKLWELIHALASWSSYLWHTDHLSDRELYTDLWSDILREPVAMFPSGSGWNNHIDMIGSGSDEDIEIGLRFYDDENSREHWRRDFPDMVIPDHEPLPFDRDRLLPQPPESEFSHEDNEDDASDDPYPDIPR